MDASVTNYVTAVAYDALRRPIRVGRWNGSGWDASEAAFDSLGRPVYGKDALGRTTETAFDYLGRMTVRTQKDVGGAVMASVTQTWDDTHHFLHNRTDPTGNATTYHYDDANRLTGKTFADGTSVSYTLNGLGEVTAATDANGSVTSVTLDAVGRAMSMAVTPGSGVDPAVTQMDFEFDGLSRTVFAANDVSEVRRRYDSRGGLLEEALDFLGANPASYTTTAAYDNRGLLTQLNYPSGTYQVGYTYDPLGLIDTVTDNVGTALVADYFYQGPGRVERKTFGNGTRYDAQFDARGRPVDTRHTETGGSTIFDRRTYAWDAVSNKTQRVEWDATGATALRTYDYVYDGLDRMEQSTFTPDGGAASVIDYALDATGNRTGVTGGPNPGAYTQTQLSPDQVHEYATTPIEAFTRQYDANGNYLGGPGANDPDMAYDALNQLTLYVSENATTTAVYTYDPFGHRIEKDVDGAITRYLSFGDRVLQEVDEQGNLEAEYTYGAYIDEVLLMRRDAIAGGGLEDYYYHTDDQYNVVKITDTNANVVEGYDYGDYGAPEFFDGTGQPITGSQIDNPYLFTGRRYDPESGNYYFRNRYMDPETGRFLTRDPIGIWGDLANLGNGYTYAGNNPWSLLDPFGLEAGGNQSLGDTLGALLPYAPALIPGGFAYTPAGRALGNQLMDDFLPRPGDSYFGDAGNFLLGYFGRPLGLLKDEAEDFVFGAKGNMGAYLLGKTMDGLFGLAALGGYLRDKYEEDDEGFLEGLASDFYNGLSGRASDWQGLGGLTFDGASSLAGGGFGVARGAGGLRGFVRGLGRKKDKTDDDPEFPVLCFVAGTLVLTADGTVPIEDIQPGDDVLSRDEETGEVAERTVVQTFVTDKQRVMDILFEADDGSVETVTVTGEHPFWVNGDGWAFAEDLLPGQKILTAHGGLIRVTGSTWRQETATVYNFEVADFHTYFVTEAGLWVHNTCPVRLPKGGTYLLRDLETGRVMRTGQTKNLSERRNDHANSDDTEDLVFEVDKYSDDLRARLGREQLLYDRYPEAQSENGGLNFVRPIRSNHPLIELFLEAGRALGDD